MKIPPRLIRGLEKTASGAIFFCCILSLSTIDASIYTLVINIRRMTATDNLCFDTTFQFSKSALREMTSHRANENEAVQLFFRNLIVASLSIVCTCTKMAAQRPNLA